MSTIIKENVQRTFRTINGDLHHIDTRGNHFINGKCVNPCLKTITVDMTDGTFKNIKREVDPIGSTYPNDNEIIKIV
jgi:hypothetical protein